MESKWHRIEKAQRMRRTPKQSQLKSLNRNCMFRPAQPRVAHITKATKLAPSEKRSDISPGKEDPNPSALTLSTAKGSSAERLCLRKRAQARTNVCARTRTHKHPHARTYARPHAHVRFGGWVGGWVDWSGRRVGGECEGGCVSSNPCKRVVAKP